MSEKQPDTAPEGRLAWMRHEIRNPLNVVVGALRLLEMTGVTPQQQKHIDMCRSSVDRINALLSDSDGAMSGPGNAEEAIRELRTISGVKFLPKPFERSDLLRTVQMAGGTSGTRRTLRLLAADDVPEVGWLLQALLDASGCKLEMVRDGAAAVARAREHEFDVILLDLEMPVMDGREAAKKIREHERAAKRDETPIIIVSGHDLRAKAETEQAKPTVSVDHEAASADADETVETDPEVAPLVPEFLANRRADVGALEKLIDAEDWETIRRMGHKMKGTGRGYGFVPISTIGGALEDAGRDKDAAAAREARMALARYLDRVTARRAGS